MSINRLVNEGDAVYVNWEMLKKVPAIVRKVYSGGEIIGVGIHPDTLEKLEVERAGYFRIHPRTGLVHLVLRPGEYEPMNRIITYGKLGES